MFKRVLVLMSFAVLKGSELNQFLPLYLKLSAQKEKIYYLFSTTGKYRYVSCSLSSQIFLRG